jgi:cell division protein FtsW (lipid II flippase)
LFWDAKHDWAYRHLWAAYGYFLSVVIVVVCILAMRKALTAGYLGKRLFGYAFCLWVVYVSSVVALYMKAPAVTIPLPFIALGVSSLLVPLASTAAAPLALASFRHA